MQRQNQWFVLGDGIAREVITADIQRYLGPDALVRPGVGTGEYQGQPGYWITAYRTLTSQMIQDLKLDSERWRQERQPGDGRGVAYENSQTHASRQHWGPSQPYDHSASAPSYAGRAPAVTRSGYAEAGYSTTPSYTTTPTQPAYGSSQYGASGAQTTPRTTQDYYQQRAPQSDYASQSGYAYNPNQSNPDPYGHGRTTVAPTQPAYAGAAPRYFGYFDNRYLDYY
jgi:hypothetical protein